MLKKRTKNLYLVLLTAAFLVLCFPGFNLWFLAWFGFVPLFFAVKDKSKLKAFLLSYLAGIIFWFGLIYWLIHVTFMGLVVLVLYLALYFGIFGLIVSSFSLSASRSQLLFIPSVWVILEYLRSHLFTGFGWALLGYSQYLNLPAIQIADITGAYGVSFLVMMVNVMIYSAINHKRVAINQRQEYILPILCILITLTYGYYKIYHLPLSAHHSPLTISVIQGNIPQELKWNISAKDFIINKYLGLSREAVSDAPDLIIWPEAALPEALEKGSPSYESMSNFSRKIDTPLLLGAVISEDNLYYNSALLFSNEGRLLIRYDKLHLVPFGEYIPLRKALGFLETVVPIGDFTPGGEHTAFTLPTTYYLLPTKFSVLICFEDIFPELSRQFVKKGAEFLVNITNDAWFGKTASPYQHLQSSVFRAVENRRFLIRAANTGVSGFIGPRGEIISEVSDEAAERIFISGYKTQEILSSSRLSFYTRYGDIFVLLVSFLALYGIIQPIKISKKQRL